MADFVLVHGGGHGSWCWDAVAELLSNRGHTVHAPTLIGLAERTDELHPGIDLETHIKQVAALLNSLAPDKVILAGHSYGGLVITGAADRASERVAWLVYIDAPVAHDDEALVDISAGLMVLAEDVIEVDGVRLGLWPDERALAIYGLTGALAEAALAKLTPHPWACFTQKLRLSDPEIVEQLPHAMLNCSGTLAHRPDRFRARLLAGDHVEEIDAPHDVMLTHPDYVADFLDRLAQE